MRLKGRNEQNRVALTVIYFLGVIAAIATLMSGFLVREALLYQDQVDAAIVALIGQMVSITTLSLGALGAMLSSTSPKPPPPPTLADGSPAPIPVEGVPGGEPVGVVRPEDLLEPEPEPDGEADPADEPPVVDSRRTRRARGGG